MSTRGLKALRGAVECLREAFKECASDQARLFACKALTAAEAAEARETETIAKVRGQSELKLPGGGQHGG